MRHLKLLPYCQGDVLPYAHSLDVSEDVLYNKEPFFPNDDFLRVSLINEELSDRMASYYWEVGDIDSIAYGNLLLRKRQLSGKRPKRLGRLSLGGIFTIGIPQGEVDRYFAS